MGVEKEGTLQLDHAAWETLRGLIRFEVTSQADLWSEALEKTKAHVDCQIAEFDGTLRSVDNEYGKKLQELEEGRVSMASELAQLMVEVRGFSATARGELRRAAIELDNKITAVSDRDNSEKNAMKDRFESMSRALRESRHSSTTSIHAKLQDLQQQVIDDRAERQATQTRCMHYADRLVAAAMGSTELEARFQAIRDSVTALDEKLQNVQASVRADLMHYSEELCSAVNARMDDEKQVADRRHDDMKHRMMECGNNAKQAATSADKAVRLVDESLHEKVHTASRNLMEQIEAAAARSVAAGHGDEFAKEQAACAAEQHSVKRAHELQAGFYSLVAREALDTEIRILVDRATRRLQVVADDLAQRSVTIQDHVIAAEERLQCAVELADRQAVEIQAQS
jgi:hypothetical protein